MGHRALGSACLLLLVSIWCPSGQGFKTTLRLVPSMGTKGFGGTKGKGTKRENSGGGFGTSSGSAGTLSKRENGGGGFGTSSSSAGTLSKNNEPSDAFSHIFLNKDPKVAKLSVAAHIDKVNLDYPGLRAVYGDPPIFEVDDVFDEATCESYIEKAEQVGHKVQSRTFNSALTGSVRTSTTWYLPYDQVPELVQAVEKLTGVPASHFEEPQIVRYEMGQQFSWHGDSIPKSMQQDGGNRLATFILYLNTLPSIAGGATSFKDLSIQCKPDQGKGLLFFPCYADGSADDRTFHCGQIAMETKWIAQIWIHERPCHSPTAFDTR